MVLVALYWSSVSPWTCLLTHWKWASRFSAAQLWHSYDAAPRLSLYIWLVFLPLLPIFSSSLALSITCHTPAIFSWPFPQTDGTVESALLAHVILFPCSFFVSERYLFNKWIFNLPVVGPFIFLGVDVKNHSERDKRRPWQSGKVLVLFFHPGSPRSRFISLSERAKRKFFTFRI